MGEIGMKQYLRAGFDSALQSGRFRALPQNGKPAEPDAPGG